MKHEGGIMALRRFPASPQVIEKMKVIKTKRRRFGETRDDPSNRMDIYAAVRGWRAYESADRALGASVIRVFRKGTKQDILNAVQQIDFARFDRASTQRQYFGAFKAALDLVARSLRKRNSRNTKVNPGLKWGHAAKILNIVIRDLTFVGQFDEAQVDRLEKFLYCPIDRVILKSLRDRGYGKYLDNGIKDIDSETKFHEVQAIIDVNARRVKIPRVWWDDLQTE
jgi:hypothetical protein